MVSIAVLTTTNTLEDEARQLAQRLNLPFTTDNQAYQYLLVLTPEYLGLKKTDSSSHPLYVDFLSDEMKRRRSQASLRRESLARALGLKGNSQPYIIDATAGLARDSFILACLGFRVQLLERSPIVYALLEDGLKRAAKDPHTQAVISRLDLKHTDAIQWMENIIVRPEFIYLDPMFPERRKTALVKKNMQYFQEVVGDDTDTETLLKTALTCATKRVVVKRPRLAVSLAGPAPAFSLTGSSSRFDIYLL